MDVSQIESRITSRTKAIMVVHTYGLPVDMDPVMDLSRRHGLRVIWGCRGSPWTNLSRQSERSFGGSVFSFYPNKHVTTGEGGDDPDR